MLALSIADHAAADARAWTFFDRSIVDATSGIAHRAGERIGAESAEHRYHGHVFLAPPWPEIYVQDAERRHAFAAAEAEYHRLHRDYRLLGYAVTILPKASVAARVDLILATVEAR